MLKWMEITQYVEYIMSLQSLPAQKSHWIHSGNQSLNNSRFSVKLLIEEKQTQQDTKERWSRSEVRNTPQGSRCFTVS